MLRPFVESDAARIELLLNDKEIASNTRTIDYLYPEGGAVEWIAKVTLWRETGDGYAFAIWIRKGDRSLSPFLGPFLGF